MLKKYRILINVKKELFLSTKTASYIKIVLALKSDNDEGQRSRKKVKSKIDYTRH